MTKILRIDASARGAESVTRQLADRIIARFEDAQVTTRDLSRGLPQIDEEWVTANFTPAGDRTPAHQETLALSDSLVDEIKDADVLVIGLPVYNFGVPSSFKAWIDQIARVGITFQYTAEGPEGLLKGKRAIVVYASGGVPMGSPVDFASGHVRQVLNFVGIEDVDFVAADSMSIDAEASLKAANEAVDALAA